MQGIWTALITPFDRTGKLDLSAFKKILEDQCAAKVQGVVICGTTGESSTLSLEEKKILVQTALEELRGSSVEVLAGTGSNNTEETIQLSRWASDQGVQGLLLVTPYYNKPSALGLEAHFKAVAGAVKCPIVLYNVPSRTAVSLNAETIAKLAAIPPIVAIKEASGSLSFLAEIQDQLLLQKQKLQILSGDDINFLPSLAVGTTGIVSVASNLFPRAMVSLYQATLQNNWHLAREIHNGCYPLFRDLFIETNPVPIKAAMALAGWCSPHVRLPLVELSKTSMNQLANSLKRCCIVPGKPA
jgi:4-hydroxy-tetrahydrodipicolinate synthase